MYIVGLLDSQMNYIVIAHKNPSQLKRLIFALKNTEDFFYVHIDRKVSIEPFLDALSDIENAIFLEGRIDVVYASISTPEIIIKAFKKILEDKRKGYCALISGQDYPIKTKQQIKDFFNRNYGANYFSALPLPVKDWWPDNGMGRINKYKFDRTKRRSDFILLPSILEKQFYTPLILSRVKRLILKGNLGFFKVLLKKREHPSYVKPYGGETWFAIPIETVKLIIDFIEEHPDFVNYHRYTVFPDEIIFSSIVMSSDTRIQENLTYVDWQNTIGGSPNTITKCHLNKLLSLPEKKLFARKFDTDEDAEILDLIDQQILNK